MANNVLIGQKFSPKRLNEPYDAIVIGSGIGGLATAAFLSKAGKKVLVLEQHYTAGGFTHSYKRKGYEWDVGVHYVGEVHRKNSVLRRIFDYITEGQLQWAKMDEVYDRLVFKEATYDLVSGTRNLTEKLCGYFPEERKAIERYVRLVYQVNTASGLFFMGKFLPPWLNTVTQPVTSRKFHQLSDQTVKEVLGSLTKNPQLQAVLAGQWGDYGMPPSEASFAIHAMVAKHYFDGACYPVGGSSSIARSIEPVILKGGGQILTNAQVERILVQDNKAIGIQIKGGPEIHAEIIISNAGVLNTYNELLDSSIAEKHKFPKKLKNVSTSASHLCLYLGLNQSAEDLKLKRANYWIYPDYDHDANLKKFLKDPENSPLPVVYISFPSAKDPEWNKRYPGKATIEVVSFAPYEWFQKWENTTWGKRGKEYEDFKNYYSNRLLEQLYRVVPQVEGHIDYQELSTPLSTKHFANYPKGEIYGLSHGPGRFRQQWLRPQTPIKNLYLTGQDVATAGVGGALMGGVLTASTLLKHNLIKRVMTRA
ncbi:NAD(P)/FAD-dependent oxidoreductase [Deltaproteobacteria bacterium TL4]